MRLFVTAMTVMFLCCFGTSCTKNTDPQSDPVFPASSFSASVDGKVFYAEDISASATGNFTVRGIRNPGNSKAVTIMLSVPHYAGLTDYAIDTATAATYSELGTTFHATSGNIIVTTNNDVHVAGTFSFEASAGSSSKNVTNGRFDVYK